MIDSVFYIFGSAHFKDLETMTSPGAMSTPGIRSWFGTEIPFTTKHIRVHGEQTDATLGQECPR